MLKKIGLIVVSLALILSLCGCDFFKTDMAELFSPPSLTGDFKYISKIIEIFYCNFKSICIYIYRQYFYILFFEFFCKSTTDTSGTYSNIQNINLFFIVF